MNTGVLGYWDDLYIYSGTQQGIFYEVDGTAPNRNVTFEFYMSHYQSSEAYYHFLIKFFESRPHVVTFQYLSVSDCGSSATVGVESENAGHYEQYSFNQAVIYPGLQLTLNTTSGNGTITVDAAGNTAYACGSV
ncbi:hypothetical protein EJ03DRAFT_297946 [Teratosphaeria nubilosa]|uniref:Uncharacterized protein n=1 Tax=Teratosphaeria nubilosa TaxID=161662 RepID=A0A6G1L1A9_9PEZI|nr:hypothetical protein EJ03DRAFT_297946 [Teratosphaeria nubilosa]